MTHLPPTPGPTGAARGVKGEVTLPQVKRADQARDQAADVAGVSGAMVTDGNLP